MGRQSLKQIAHALAMFGGNRNGVAQTQFIGFVNRGGIGVLLDLVGDQHDRHLRRSQPSREMTVGGRDPGASVDHHQGGGSIVERRLRLQTHTTGERFRPFIFQTCRVDGDKVQVAQLRRPLPPVACNARRIIDDSDALADQPVEKRRLADVRPPDDDDLWKACHEASNARR